MVSNNKDINLSVSVAIPCYNAERFLPDLLGSLQHQTIQPDEILVVDDGSVDLTSDIAKRYSIKLIRHDQNRGLACARNTALEGCTGDIIVFFDADTFPDNRCLELMLREYRRNEIAGVGGQELFCRAERVVDLWRNLFWRQTHGEERIDSAWMLMGLCCSYRTEVLRKIGGFNEEYRTNGEDVDLGLRMTKEGYRLVYLPDVGVHHQRTDTLLSLMSLAYRHSYWQSRAMRENGTDPYSQFKWAVRWLAVSTDSSILRHRDIRLAIISPIVCFSAFAGRIMEMVLRSRL